MCRKTILGPTFGSPLRKIEILPKFDENLNETDERLKLDMNEILLDPPETFAEPSLKYNSGKHFS